jgi:hypothetical protein
LLESVWPKAPTVRRMIAAKAKISFFIVLPLKSYIDLWTAPTYKGGLYCYVVTPNRRAANEIWSNEIGTIG